MPSICLCHLTFMITVIITLTKRHGTPQVGDCQGTLLKGHTGGGGRRRQTGRGSVMLNHGAGAWKRRLRRRSRWGEDSLYRVQRHDCSCKSKCSQNREWIQRAKGGRWSSKHLSSINVEGDCTWGALSRAQNSKGMISGQVRTGRRGTIVRTAGAKCKASLAFALLRKNDRLLENI